jgi:hypothetical protein
VGGGGDVEGADALVVVARALVGGGAFVFDGADGAVLDGGVELEAGGVASPVPSPELVLVFGGAGGAIVPRLGVVAPVVLGAAEPDSELPPVLVVQPASRTAAPRRQAAVRRTNGMGIVIAAFSRVMPSRVRRLRS